LGYQQAQSERAPYPDFAQSTGGVAHRWFRVLYLAQNLVDPLHYRSHLGVVLGHGKCNSPVKGHCSGCAFGFRFCTRFANRFHTLINLPHADASTVSNTTAKLL